MLVYIVADYGHGDLAFSEVVQRIRTHLPDAEPILTPAPAFSTLAAGFCIAQLGLDEAPPGTLIYHNVAPRADDPEARAGNAGEQLSYARLRTGVRVIGVPAGHTLAFIRDEAEKLRWAATPAEGSQFRSRDLFPQAAAALALGHAGALGEDIDRPSRAFRSAGSPTSTGTGPSRRPCVSTRRASCPKFGRALSRYRVRVRHGTIGP